MKRTLTLMVVAALLFSCGQGNQTNNTDDSQLSPVKCTAGLGNAPKMEPTEVLNLYEGKAPGSESWTNVEAPTDESGGYSFQYIYTNTGGLFARPICCYRFRYGGMSGWRFLYSFLRERGY